VLSLGASAILIIFIKERFVGKKRLKIFKRGVKK
jgi:hypothetical protein